MSDVIVVEADPEAATAAEEFLTSLGHTVRVASFPRAALRKIIQRRPDAVLAGLGFTGCTDPLLPVVCDSLTILLMDLGDAICLAGRNERESQGNLPDVKHYEAAPPGDEPFLDPAYTLPQDRSPRRSTSLTDPCDRR